MARTSSSGKKFVPSAVTEDLKPAVDNATQLGTSAKRWSQFAAVLAVVTTLTATGLVASSIDVSTANITALDGNINASYYNISFLDTITLDQSCYPSANTSCDNSIKFNGTCIITKGPTSTLEVC